MKTNTIASGVMGLATVLVGAAVVFLGTYGWRGLPGSQYPKIGEVLMEGTEYFSSSYQSARESFLNAARDAGGSIQSLQNPNTGPDGGTLFTDVALFGPGHASTFLVVSSGTHGVEGFAGSGIQTGLLREGIVSGLPPDVGLLMIHAINPYGFAHLRRWNEDNVDLNRNFLDHDGEHPENPQYAALAHAIAPTSISFWSEAASWFEILRFLFRHGLRNTDVAVSGGQYDYPKGLFYGGRPRTWSNQTIRSIAGEYLSGAERVVVIDIHTGRGEYGKATILSNVQDTSDEFSRTLSIWGGAGGADAVESTVTGEAVSPHLHASVKLAFTEILPEAEVTAATLEFGTFRNIPLFKALRLENWLHHHGRSEDPRAPKIKASLLRCFYPDSDEWKAVVWTRGKEVVEQALDWLSPDSS
jgi:hypothetical protein